MKKKGKKKVSHKAVKKYANRKKEKGRKTKKKKYYMRRFCPFPLTSASLTTVYGASSPASSWTKENKKNVSKKKQIKMQKITVTQNNQKAVI